MVYAHRQPCRRFQSPLTQNPEPSAHDKPPRTSTSPRPIRHRPRAGRPAHRRAVRLRGLRGAQRRTCSLGRCPGERSEQQTNWHGRRVMIDLTDLTGEAPTARDAVMDKVRKLLRMAHHANANEQERETAFRQANILLTRLGIDEAEVDLATLTRGEMRFGEASCGPDGKAVYDGTVVRSIPTWVGILALGCARYTGTLTRYRDTAQGTLIVFQGERGDVVFARWLLSVLAPAILAEQKASGWTRRGEAEGFRRAAAGVLQKRLAALRAETLEAFRASESRALAVVDRKALEIERRFGAQPVGKTRRAGSDGARIAGREAGARINIPRGGLTASSGQRRLK